MSYTKNDFYSVNYKLFSLDSNDVSSIYCLLLSRVITEPNFDSILGTEIKSYGGAYSSPLRTIYAQRFFSLSFLSRTFTIHGTAGKGGAYLFNSSLPLPPASQRLRHQPGNYCRELTSAHSWQPDSNREPLVSKRKSLTTKLHALKSTYRQST